MSDIKQIKKVIEENPKPISKNWLILILAVITFSVMCILAMAWGYGYIVEQGHKAKQIQSQLEIEFKNIPPLPKVNLIKYDASSKSGIALVDANYFTDTNASDIFKYYDGQLRQRGWQFKGNDLGGKTAYYCKGDYAADVFYLGQKANNDWTYAFSISWGLHDCKPGN